MELRKVVDQWTPLLAKLTGQPNRIAEEKAGEVATDMKELAQELVRVRTGYLRSTIHAEAEGTTVTLGASADYASYNEFGTYKMSAQPFLRPAFDLYAPSILDRIRDGVMRLIGL